jgi:serine/threonine-protein kinase
VSDEPKSQRSVLALIADRTGVAPKVFLSDLDSELGASPVVDPTSTASKLVPQGRGNYQLLGEIARGGMGVILKGHDTDLGRDVAVKVLDGELSKRPEVVQRFVEEAQIGGQLQHPGIVPVYELGLMADDRPYFTMKLVKGRTLAALFGQRKLASDNRGRLLAIFESVCQTMAYAHSKGVLHRDLKPANVMVGAFGEVQVVDWGLAKVLRRGGVADEKRSKETLHTVIETVRSGSGSTGSDSMVGSVMGTPAYMAPEQAQGEVDQLDARADVFSLGAILCELLTGRPPYEEQAGEPILTQASRAKLQPARARIEACEADPQLVQLCLQCLMPARTARPANAAEVASAVHEYLASVEERAQKAELAAEKSRIKAEEERRAKRLTMALGGTILVALLGGGGGLWWIQHERERRAVHTRAAVEAAHGESSELGRAGKPEQALAAARRALSLAETGEADAALLDRARSFVAAAELEVSAAERERTLRAQDDALRERLIDLRLRQIAANHNHPREIQLDEDFAKAFRDYGVELEGDDLVPALTRIRERSIAGEVALVLDDWGRLRRHVRGDMSKESENLFLLAMDLDPDPERLRMREAIAAHDRTVMLELTSNENLPKLQPGSISILCAELWGEGALDDRPDVYRILEQALQLYPGDFLLQAFAGSFYNQGQRFESALLCRSAAMSLRPGDLVTRADLADSMFALGRLTEAQTTLRTCVTADPSNAEAWQLLSMVQILLGDLAGALASATDKPGIESDPEKRVTLHLAQYYAGIRVREQIERDLASETNVFNLATSLLALADHPDPKQRDPALVLRTLEERASSLTEARWRFAVEAIARARIEDWTGALSVVDHREPPSYVMVLTPMAHEFLRALIYSRAGRAAEARTCYELGIAEWNERTALDPVAWERSDAMRWRREAEAAMAK